MNPFEYALGLISILMSLALADIAMSFHRVMRHCRTVKWDGRVVLSTALVILTIVRMWFAVWAVRDVGMVLVFAFYLSLFIEFMILFLLAAACLPDEPASDCRLAAFYEGNQRYFWLIFFTFQASYFGHWLYFGGRTGSVGGASLHDWARLLGPALIYLALAFLRNKLLHYAAPALLIVYYLWLHWDQSLSTG